MAATIPLQSPTNASGVTRSWKHCHSSGTCSLNCSSFSSYFANAITGALKNLLKGACWLIGRLGNYAPNHLYVLPQHGLQSLKIGVCILSMMMNMSVVFRGLNLRRIVTCKTVLSRGLLAACSQRMSWHHMLINNNVRHRHRKQQALLLEWCIILPRSLPSVPSKSITNVHGSAPSAHANHTPCIVWLRPLNATISISTNLASSSSTDDSSMSTSRCMLCSAAPSWPPSHAYERLQSANLTFFTNGSNPCILNTLLLSTSYSIAAATLSKLRRCRFLHLPQSFRCKKRRNSSLCLCMNLTS